MVLNKCLAVGLILVTTALGVATGGCAGTACDKAEMRTDECFGAKSTGTGVSPGPTEDCSGAVECQANCYDQYDCSVYKDFRSGKPAGKPLADCLTECGSSG
jgi:hypothetical protein